MKTIYFRLFLNVAADARGFPFKPDGGARPSPPLLPPLLSSNRAKNNYAADLPGDRGIVLLLGFRECLRYLPVELYIHFWCSPRGGLYTVLRRRPQRLRWDAASVM